MPRLAHHVFGLREEVAIRHGGQSILLVFRREKAASEAPIRVSWTGPGSFTVTSPRADRHVITHGDAVMGFRAYYENRPPNWEKFTIGFYADAEWEIEWRRHDRGRVPGPSRPDRRLKGDRV